MTVHGVSFVWPAVLLGLLVLPALLAAYAVSDRRRRRAVSRFGNPALLPNLVPKRLGAARHLPVIVLLVALAALLVGAARPQREVARPTRQATIVLAIDSSRSMSATDVTPSRLAAARAAARSFVAKLPTNAKVGVVSFTRRVRPLNAPTSDRAVIYGSLDSLRVGGGTAMGDALVASLHLIPKTPAATAASSRPPAAIVLLSDGASTEGKVGPGRAAALAKQRHVPIYTVSLGTDAGQVVDPGTGKTLSVKPDPASLARLARSTGGKAYTAADAGQLNRVYATIGTQIGSERRAQDVAMVFLAAGGALVLAAGALSLRFVGSFA